MATVLYARTSAEVASDPALEKVNSECGVEYARARFGRKLRQSNNGLKIEANFCPEDETTPFDTVSWELDLLAKTNHQPAWLAPSHV